MNNKVIMVLCALISGCATSGSTSVPPIQYTGYEASRLAFCLGMADTARAVLDMRDSGKTKDEIIGYYKKQADAKHPDATTLALSIVDHVYQDPATPRFDYLNKFYIECGQNLAKVNADRISPAAYCYKKQQVVDMAFSFKLSGKDKQALLAKLNMKPDSAAVFTQITDEVYADQSNDRVKVKSKQWDDCMRAGKD